MTPLPVPVWSEKVLATEGPALINNPVTSSLTPYQFSHLESQECHPEGCLPQRLIG